MAIAEIALVSDISGVCSRRETFWITWNPTKVASMNTNNMDQRSRVVCTRRVYRTGLRPPARPT